jgi:ABC-type polysaccharide/polyol phosphate export permease
LILVALWNPLSRVSDLIRGYLMGAPAVTFASWIELLSFSGLFILVGAGLYAAAIERSTT